MLRGAALASFIPPLLSLIFLVWNIPIEVFTLAFFTIGGRTAGIMMGGNNYILQHSPAEKRPLYIGLTNSTLGLTLLSASLGGLIVDEFGYGVLFLVVLFITICAGTAAVRMKPAGVIPDGDGAHVEIDDRCA